MYQEAQAARSGGRIGGTASAARSKPPPRAPVASSSSKTDGGFWEWFKAKDETYEIFMIS